MTEAIEAHTPQDAEAEAPETPSAPTAADENGARAPLPTAGLAAQWNALLETLPPDWSHLYAEVILDSTAGGGTMRALSAADGK